MSYSVVDTIAFVHQSYLISAHALAQTSSQGLFRPVHLCLYAFKFLYQLLFATRIIAAIPGDGIHTLERKNGQLLQSHNFFLYSVLKEKSWDYYAQYMKQGTCVSL
ncbi:uncharacterized protein LOC141893665 [Acropora palmata]|uniref:uncharacterized protein LOC141893665 n=1 Tax=Acropora palmata TaxID=6131 RepID=UPI003DA11CF7